MKRNVRLKDMYLREISDFILLILVNIRLHSFHLFRVIQPSFRSTLEKEGDKVFEVVKFFLTRDNSFLLRRNASARKLFESFSISVKLASFFGDRIRLMTKLKNMVTLVESLN